MRLFLTSYQKSGTHQIMPALDIMQDVVDRSYVDMEDIEHYIPYKSTIPISDTLEVLRYFQNRLFGHIPYLHEYVYALQYRPTKVLFNVRDPRDIIVSNWHSIQKLYFGGEGYGHLNMMDTRDGKYLAEKPDPISELIRVEAKRWPHWLGWLDHDFTMMVHYEDIRTNDVETFQKIKEFMNPHDIDVDRCIQMRFPKPQNPTFRRGEIGNWKKEFNDDQKCLAIELLGSTIKRLGYEL